MYICKNHIAPELCLYLQYSWSYVWPLWIFNHIWPLSIFFLQYFKFWQNQIFGLYDKTRYFKMVTFTWILWIPSKITFSCQYSHVTCSVVVIFGNAKNNFPKSRFWPNFDQKRGIFDPYLEILGSNHKNNPIYQFIGHKTYI